MNEYLEARNKKFYRGSTKVIHPLYDIEINRTIEGLKNFLNQSILGKARLLREKTLNNIALEKCWKNNNFSYSESRACHDLIFKHDSVLGNIEKFTWEMETNIMAEYQNKISPNNDSIFNNNSARGIGQPKTILNEKALEVNHRKFLLNVHLFHRFYYFYLAKHLFIDKLGY